LTPRPIKRVRTDELEIAYEEAGPADGPVAILSHGFPYDPRAFDDVVARLAAAGMRTIVPYLRGYGPTHFLSPDTPRSGQQAALAHDLRALMDALDIATAVHGGYDWGGRAACIVAALWPERVTGLVTCMGYNIQDIPGSAKPAPAEFERGFWYQYYFHTERGRAGLTENRRDICKLLWQTWSPEWSFSDETFESSAKSFNNPDFVDVVIQSYRHRFGNADGDPAFAAIETELESQPHITVPTIAFHGDADGVFPVEWAEGQEKYFDGLYDCRIIPHVGHNVPQEVPDLFANAILELRG
jgi:pimeloyl-ACP methyl ester carboxylesterase